MKEFFTVQNPALGALSLYHFTKTYYETNDNVGVDIPLTMIILPMVFNERCLDSISKVRRVSGRISMLNVLAEHRDIPVGLQKRLIEMGPQSLRALNMAFAKGLISYDKAEKKLTPNKYLRIPASNSNENQKIFQASRVIGKWFAFNSLEQICIALNISFNPNEF